MEHKISKYTLADSCVDAHAVLQWLEKHIIHDAMMHLFTFCGEEVLWMLQWLGGNAAAAAGRPEVPTPSNQWWDIDRVVATCAKLGMRKAIELLTRKGLFERDDYFVARCAAHGLQTQLCMSLAVNLSRNLRERVAISAAITPGGAQLALKLGIANSEYLITPAGQNNVLRASNYDLLGIGMSGTRRAITELKQNMPFDELFLLISPLFESDAICVGYIRDMAIASNNRELVLAALAKRPRLCRLPSMFGACSRSLAREIRSLAGNEKPDRLRVGDLWSLIRNRDTDGVKEYLTVHKNSLDLELNSKPAFNLALTSGATRITKLLLAHGFRLRAPALNSWCIRAGVRNRARQVRMYVAHENKRGVNLQYSFWPLIVHGAWLTSAVATLRAAIELAEPSLLEVFLDTLSIPPREGDRLVNALRCVPGRKRDFGGSQRAVVDYLLAPERRQATFSHTVCHPQCVFLLQLLETYMAPDDFVRECAGALTRYAWVEMADDAVESFGTSWIILTTRVEIFGAVRAAITERGDDFDAIHAYWLS